MTRKVSVSADALIALHQIVNTLEESSREGETVLIRGDVDIRISSDEDYVTIEDIGNGGIVEVPAEWFEEAAVAFMKKRQKPDLNQAKLLRQCRVGLGMSLRTAAQKLEMTAVLLGEIERGKRVPASHELERMAKLYIPPGKELLSELDVVD